MNHELIPPLEIRLKVGPFNETQSYLDWGQHEFNKLKDYGNLSSNDTILDLGCGCGRVAIHIADYLKKGHYLGLDNYFELIRWCKTNIEPLYTNMQFKFINVYSGYYNPEGSLHPSDLVLPSQDNNFSFVFGVSLFTHMFVQDIESYMTEIARVLQTGGRLYATYFLLRDDRQKDVSDSESPNQPQQQRRKSIADDMKTPEKKLSHPEEIIQEIYDRVGFSITRIEYGNWRTSLPTFPEPYQDTIVAEKL